MKHCEVEVRGGQSDLLVFTREQRYLYETKIWRGEDYYRQGLREIEEYIIGEDDDGALPSVFYIVFDPTTTRRAEAIIGSAVEVSEIAGRPVTSVVVHIRPPRPSKKIA